MSTRSDFDDLYEVGVLARMLRIIPMEQGGAQVVLNMEKRISIKKPIKASKHLKAQINYHEDIVTEKLLKSSKLIRSASSRRSKSCLSSTLFLKKSCKFF